MKSMRPLLLLASFFLLTGLSASYGADQSTSQGVISSQTQRNNTVEQQLIVDVALRLKREEVERVRALRLKYRGLVSADVSDLELLGIGAPQRIRNG